jgi:hypothetical protein
MADTDPYAFYYGLRSEARKRVVAALNRKARTEIALKRWASVIIRSIDQAALDYTRMQWPRDYQRTNYHGMPVSWETLLLKFSPKPSFFDIAVWQRIDDRDVLQGLALGKPNKSRSKLSLNFVETNTGEDYLQGGVLFAILGCAEEYARLIGCTKLVIKKPLDPAVYAKYGFEHSGEPDQDGSLWKGV